MEEGSFRSNLAVVGLGLIGGSYAMALSKGKAGTVFGIDIDEKVLERAFSCGAIAQGSTDAAEILGKSDIVILSLYPSETIEFIKRNSGKFKPGAIITDTCGIKEPIIEAASGCLPDNVEFIGGHPMAGNEFQGFEAASGELFINTNYILTPNEGNTEKGIRTMERLATLIGCNRITRIKASEHDRMISFTSQLPHIVAISFANLAAGEKDMKAFTGRSFMDATRVAVLNRKLWSQIFRMNNLNIIDRIEDMEAMLAKLKNAILEQDDSSLQLLFENAVKGKREMC